MKVAAKGHVYIPNYEYEFEYYDYETIDHTNFSHGKCNFVDITTTPEGQAMKYIELVGFAIILLQGLVGNLLAIPILCKVSRRAWSTVIYLAILGVTDLIILLVQCGDAWYRRVAMDSLSSKIMDYSDAMCKTYNFVFTCVKHLTPWLLVASALEMVVATRCPKMTYTMCTLQRARYVLMLMVIIIVCLDINYFWTYGVPKRALSCVYTEDFSSHFRDWIWPVIENTVELALPLLVVSICFFITAITMIRRPAGRERDLEVQMKSYFLEPAALRDFRNVCLILSLIFMCLASFKLAFHILKLLINREFIDMDCKFVPATDLIGQLIKTSIHLFQSCKIYIYLSLSSLFRHLLAQGFRCIGRKIAGVGGSVKKLVMVKRKGRGDITQHSQTRPLIHNRDKPGQSNSYKAKAADVSSPGAENNPQDVIDLTDHQAGVEHNNLISATGNGGSELMDGYPVRNSRVDTHSLEDSQPDLTLGTKV